MGGGDAFQDAHPEKLGATLIEISAPLLLHAYPAPSSNSFVIYSSSNQKDQWVYFPQHYAVANYLIIIIIQRDYIFRIAA